MAFVGTLILNVEGLWRFGDIANSAMLIPNVIALILLSGAVISMTKRFDKTGELPPNFNGDDWGTTGPADPAEDAPAKD